MQLYQGDCLEVMKDIPDKTIDCIICDLPYNMTSCKWDKMLDLNKLFLEYERIIKNGGVITLFGSEPFSSLLRTAKLDWFKYDWIWVKEQSSSGLQAKFQPLKKHEIISVFYQTLSKTDTTNMFDNLKEYMISERQKTGLTSEQMHKLLGSYMGSHYFTRKTQFAIPTKQAYEKLQTTGFFKRPYEEIQTEYKAELNKETVSHSLQSCYNPQMEIGKPYKAHYAPGTEVHGKSEHYVKENTGTRYPTSILRFNREKGLHPTQKPVPLLEYLIKTYTNEGETVLDNCMGSGSTGVACLNTGRDFIGIELDEDYFTIAKNRIESAKVIT